MTRIYLILDRVPKAAIRAHRSISQFGLEADIKSPLPKTQKGGPLWPAFCFQRDVDLTENSGQCVGCCCHDLIDVVFCRNQCR